MQRLYGLPDIALIDMGDFAGGMLKYLRRHPIARLTIAGGFGKLSKLAGGAHGPPLRPQRGRSRAACRSTPQPRRRAELAMAARSANTAGEILGMAQTAGLALGDLIAGEARDQALAMVDGKVAVEVIVIDRGGEVVGRAGF